MSTFVSQLQTRAQKYPQRTAVTYLEDGEKEKGSLTYLELDQRARQIASFLQAHRMKDKRVILLYPTGLDFISSLMGCWYAGVVAVPVNCPKPSELEKHQDLFNTIIEDAEAKMLLCLSTHKDHLENLIKPTITIIATDSYQFTESKPYKSIAISPDSLAYLQYTSGSVAAPKAAMVSHGNLEQSLKDTMKAWQYTNQSVTLNWAPHTHVYGLVCGLLIPLYHGTPAIIMPPAVFINKPLLWLAAISKYRASHGGCPNFGYDLCVRDIKESDLDTLDLRTWKVAVNGGDMAQYHTLMEFSDKFSACGFSLDQFNSAYGMSEAAGAIAVTGVGEKPGVNVHSNRQLISSGKLLKGLQAIVVNPDTGLAVADGETGEIWLSGKAIVSGYWRRPEENKAVFNAKLPGNRRSFFRTGDLGFINNGELFLSGRLKEVMVIYGKKYYPLDFEITVAQSLNPFAIKYPQVVFSTEISNKEEIIIVQEVADEHKSQLLQIKDAICHAIAKNHSVNVYKVIFCPQGTIPRTASGKIQRKKAQQLFNEKKLESFTVETEVQTSNLENTGEDFSSLVARVLKINPEQIDLNAPLSRYGFDSINIIHLITLLNESYQLDLSPATLYEYATLAEFYQDFIRQNHAATEMTQAASLNESTDIAIIGISGLFPQAENVDIFWQNLAQGKDCVTDISPTRWNAADLSVYCGGFLENVDQFDAAFFNISPREAELIDPQQRLFLQTVWSTIEDAGYTPSKIAALKTGLFVGVFNHDYAELLQKNEVMDAYLTTGTMNSMIANRISYLLNLRGPSEAIDTACSSSLVAIHQAVHAILQGDCELAIAGGVNVLSTATSFNSATKAGMLSDDGRCKTFDKEANGYVRGEGVGAILLKKLPQALRDADHIYGVIKGTATNHGGHVNTLTAPNPNAQADVIVSACLRANIPVNSIQYIETHGTGTPLGDPIEINGLKKAFQQLAITQNITSLEKNSCGLGAVKTHIGHLESAAGIAGVIKILLAMRHELLPANLHFTTLNPYIDIKDSPFYIIDSNTKWPKKTGTTPRRAGISSFGFGGSNAHIILEESPEPATAIPYPLKAYLITLSAQTTNALQQRKADLLQWLEQEKNPDMAALSYTLNAGRHHFDQRFALVVNSAAELKKRLKSNAEHKEPVANKLKDAEFDLHKECGNYLQGKSIDWETIYGSYQQKIVLPTYPFAKESHWVASNNKSKSRIHPLIDENRSTLTSSTFSKQFIGNEWYLSEHQVNNAAALPGALCLEMAQVAAGFALNKQSIHAMSNILWQKAISGSDLQNPIHIHLMPDLDSLAFVMTDAQAKSYYVSGDMHYGSPPQQPVASGLDLSALKSSLTTTQTSDAIYQYFNKAGLHYGPNFQVIRNLQYSESELLAELHLTTEAHDFIMHPCLFDGVLQSTQALLKNRDHLYLPLGIKQINIYGGLPAHCYVYAELKSSPEEQQTPVFDLQVIDEAGQLLMQITGFSLGAFTKESISTAYYQPVWIEKKIKLENPPIVNSIVIVSNNPATLGLLQQQFKEAKAVSSIEQLDESNVVDYILLPMEQGSTEDIQRHLDATYYLLQNLIVKIHSLKPPKQIQILCLCKPGSIYFRALAGYAKTLQQEFPKIACRIIELFDFKVLADELNQSDIQVSYDQKNTRSVRAYQTLPEIADQQRVLLKKSGVYLITGGMGGLGLIIATYLAKQYQAKLVLVGRSVLSKKRQQQLLTLESQGASVLYLQADIAQQSQVFTLVEKIKDHFGAIDGIIHAAGLTQDSLILNKTREESQAVFAPKIQGTCHLHQATQEDNLDFFLLFSSVASVFGNAGQSDYAYANSFQDEFAYKKGIYSINWPLWRDGGLHIADEYQKLLEKTLGIVSLSTEEGVEAFAKALKRDAIQTIVLPGHQPKLISALKKRATIHLVNQDLPEIQSESLYAATESYLQQLIEKTLRLPSDSIKPEVAFDQYGIDSLMIIQLNEQLEQRFTDLPKTLFFEYQNLASLTHYFVSQHAKTLSEQVIDKAPTPRVENTFSFNLGAMRKKGGDIAIVGIDGRYPEANNLAEFWNNLQSGKDCISEIPAQRWNVETYFNEDKDASGSTYSKWGGFIKDVDAFDPLFFNISPREATLMDPQERLFLQCAWNTVENAGYAREQLAGKKIGVYVGVMYGQYQLYGHDKDSAFVATNSVFASIANRVSYFFDFHGPSMALDTMCSSSLTAIHLACKSIQEGECEMALAGGVNLSLHPNKYLLLSEGSFLASDGHCRSFGAGGDGYVPGEGVGAVLLKSLESAIKDGDTIYAVIKGSQLNHGGKTNGYTVPNPNAQAQLIAETYQKANINPASVSYLEAHGTGTSLGDPIEIAGLNKAFADKGLQQCAIGSIKSNIGHCESAAGIAALTKVVLQLQYKKLVPSLLSEQLNSNINWSTTPFKVQQTLSDWPQATHQARVAGISSFGAGGANAHLIISEAPAYKTHTGINKSHYLLTLSAKTELALKQRADDLLDWLEQNPGADLQQIAYSLNTGRSHFACRSAVVVSSTKELIEKLQQSHAGHHPSHVFISRTGEPVETGTEVNHTPQSLNTLLALAQDYVAGKTLDWEALHAGEARKKIALPTYPFAKERYWYSDNDLQGIAQELSVSKQSPLSEKIAAFLTRQAQSILKITQHKIDVANSLGDYGMDSVHFIELAKRIAEHYQIEFTPAVFFTHSSVETISHYLLKQHPSVMANTHQFFEQTSPQLSADKTRMMKHYAVEDIAIIGMQGVFPQSDDLNAFWQHLVAGDDMVSEVPTHRWDWRTYYGQGSDQGNSKWGGFINQVDQFDAGFFNISAREANLMDPQQRLFLETVWKTIEDAGYNPLELASQKVGVFAGVEFSEYQTLIAKQGREHHGFIATGNSHSMIANRVSYFFNFQGPSEAIDTACSSSLVAIHRAVQALRHGECELAIAGGVSLMLDPSTVVVTSQLGALSADGRCKTFDKSANGYVKGEGVGSLLLKPVKQAQKDGDHIYGVIKASAVNHGGKAQSLTAPNATAQSELLIKAYSQAQISPDSVTYIETHGTGTALGDPVEIEGLKLAFKHLLQTETSTKHIALGSVKTNIGHLEPASGIAGVIKLLLSMQHEIIPGILHLNELNPYINLNDSPFYIAKDQQVWERITTAKGDTLPLRAGVSSFGFGGTNAHVVIEEGRPHQTPLRHVQSKPYYLISLSAKQHDSLQQKIIDLQQWIARQENLSLASLSFTLNVGRAHFIYRCALVVASIEELSQALAALANQETPDYCIVNEGQTCSMQGPVFDEVYQSAMRGLNQAEDDERYRHHLFILADLYTKHYPLDWQLLFNGEAKQRIASLPAYPFLKQRYWFDLERQSSSVEAMPSLTSMPINRDLSTATLAYLQSVFAEKLGTVAQAIQVDETYEVYGVDSIIGLEITNRLEKDFGTLPKTILYERNRLVDLAKYFIKSHKDTLTTLVSVVDTLPVQAASQASETEVTHRPPVSSNSQDIAIIGLSGTFPMANSMDEFWHNLTTGRDCVGEVPLDRWNYRDYPVQVGGEEKYFSQGGFIPDVDKFDPLFFNISPRDAGFMDPQERLFMQSVWSTLEDAGYTREKLKRHSNNAVGVFAGVTYNFYPLFIAEEWQKGNRVPLDIQSFSVANRISYFLNLNGPSFVVDTACSSSLAAIHLACDSIQRGDCAMAIAGGVNLSLHPSKYHFLGSFSFMSEQGRCTSFGEGGTGYVPSEGVGSVLLKPLDQAIADNDLIYGVIKASSMNHGGKTSGYTVPNPNAQSDVILKALHSANIDARTISYIEAHGTGTALGDPIEVRGLQEAFENFTEDKQYCAIGSVKSNIGHLESAAGISQLAKVLLQMRHKQLVPSLHAEKLNPFIDFANSPFYVQRELSDWNPDNNVPRRAGVSSFGAGGANVHMIVEEYIPPVKSQAPVNGPFLFTLSALNEDRLTAQVQQLVQYLQNNNPTDKVQWLRDACYTLQVGREAMTSRLAILVKTTEDLLQALINYPNTSSNLWLNYQSQNNLNTPAVSGQHLEEIAASWVSGEKINWQQLYPQQLPTIISLPTYPFTKRRCWISTKKVEPTAEIPKVVQATTPVVIEQVKAADGNEWLYSTHWEKNPSPHSGDNVSVEGMWLIFSDRELGLLLQKELGLQHCIYAFTAESFSRHSDKVFYYNPNHTQDYDRLLKTIVAEQKQPLAGIVYLSTALTIADPSLPLLYLFKSMVQHTLQQPIRFCLATQSAQSVTTDDPINIGQHALWSMTRIFAAEQANCKLVMLDLDGKASLQQNSQHLVKELNQQHSNQNHLAYRSNERYSIRFKLDEPVSNKTSWSAPVAALITGGLGALGYEVADYLATQGTKYLLLTGTTILSDTTQEKNGWLKQLENKGLQVRYVAVDVADKEAMQLAIQAAETSWQQAIDGVFHLAGITTDNVTIADMDEALWREVLRVKADGAMVLHELFLNAPLSAFVLFSSIAAVPHFGMAGLSAYAVANEFISGLALYRRALQLPAISINWVAWSEKGMSHRHNHDAFLDAVGMASLSIKEGIALFDTILKANPAEITVCKIQWKKFLQINATAKQLDFFKHFIAQYAAMKTTARSSLSKEEIAQLVLSFFTNVLALEENEVDIDTPFQQYGMDSIVGINFTAALDEHFPDTVSPMDLYRYPTLKQLSDYIIEQAHQANSEDLDLTRVDEPPELDIEQLNVDQLNALLESELKELELTYE